MFQNIFPNFGQIFYIAFLFTFKYYGWVLFVIGTIYLLWKSYYKEIMHQYVHDQDWIFLHIKVPRENQASLVGVETIFSQMHALHGGKTFHNKYVEGQIQLWYSLEIVSLGGKISFIMRIPKKLLDTVESAIYSQYPLAEISEVRDYMEHFHFDPYSENEKYDLFGFEWKIQESDTIPIKTYKDFEHPTAEQKIIDPLGNFFEGLAKMKPYELMAYQIIIQPLADDEWHKKSELKVKELIGEEVPHEASWMHFLTAPLDAFAKFSFTESLIGHGGHGHGEDENKQRNNWTTMTEVEKERVGLVERKLGKPGYKTKIRCIYFAPKDKFDNSRKQLMSGLYRPLGSEMRNKFKPESVTWIGLEPAFSTTLEKPMMEARLRRRKKHLFKGFKERDIHIGKNMFILNTEEIATLYHFPITTETTLAPAAVEKTESKKSQPPVNLPVAEVT